MKKKLEFSTIEESRFDSFGLKALTNDEMSDVLGAWCGINVCGVNFDLRPNEK